MLSPKNTTTSAAALSGTPGAPTQDWLEAASVGMANAYVIQVTPHMAETWLGQNEWDGRRNRRFRKSHARTLATEMRTGQWKLTHQGIAFGVSGRLLDGQHRLAAIVDSGTTQPLLVFIDAPEEGFANYDRGATRNVADVLIADTKRVAIASTIVRFCVRGFGDDSRRAMPGEVQKLLEVYGPDITAQYEASATQRSGHTIAPIRAAWVLRHHVADTADRALLCAQWKAFAEYDPKRMDETTGAGDKRLQTFRTGANGSRTTEAGCIGWLMFDPSRRDMTRILIRSTSTAMDEMRATVRATLPGLVINPGEPKRATDAAAAATVVTPAKPRSQRWCPMSDPVLGPVLRAKAVTKVAENKAARQTRE